MLSSSKEAFEDKKEKSGTDETEPQPKHEEMFEYVESSLEDLLKIIENEGKN